MLGVAASGTGVGSSGCPTYNDATPDEHLSNNTLDY